MSHEVIGQIKGTAVKTIPLFVEKLFGKEGYQRWLDALPEKSRSFFSDRIRVSQWYDIHEAAVVPTRAFCELFYQGSFEGALEAGRFSAEWSLRGIYRAMVRVGSPHWVTARAAQLSRLYYRPCRVEIVKEGKNQVLVKLLEFPTTDPYVEHRIVGYTERATELSGSRNLKTVFVSSAHKGDRYTSVRQSWT